MMEKLREHVEGLFTGAPKTKKAVELKEELLANLIDKYNDLVAQGNSEQEAFAKVKQSIGDIDELIRGLKETDVMDYGRMQQERKRTALVVSIAVGLYMLAFLFLIITVAALHKNPVTMFAMTVLISAFPTCLLIYHFMSRPKYQKTDDTIVEEFKEWKSKSSHTRKVYQSVSSIFWTLTVAIYLLLSFMTGAWFITWIIFIIASAVDKIIKLAFQLKEAKDE